MERAKHEPKKPADKERHSWLRDLLLTLPAVLISAVVAFAVAHYTARNEVESQRVAAQGQRATARIAAQNQRAAALYVPLRTALANVVACVSPTLCSDDELFQADRSLNTAIIAAYAEGPPSARAALDAVQAPLALLVEDRLANNE